MRISDWSSDVCSSDLLDHNVDIGMANHLHAVGGDQNIVAHQSARLFDITHGNRRDFDTAPRPAGDFLDVACQYLPGARPHHTQAPPTNFYRTHLTNPSLLNFSFMPRTTSLVPCPLSTIANRHNTSP